MQKIFWIQVVDHNNIHTVIIYCF